MATKKGGFRNIVPFWFALFAAVSVLVACGDDSASSSADEYDTPSSDSNNPSEMALRSSSSWNYFYSSIGSISTNPDSVNVQDSLKGRDTIPGNHDFVRDTDWVSAFDFTGVSLDKYASPFISLEGATTSVYEAGTTDTAGFMSPFVTVNLAGVTLLGAPAQKISLSLTVDLSESEQVEVNLFNHLLSARTLTYEWKGFGQFEEAFGKAAADVWKAFRLPEIATGATQEEQDGASLALHVMVSHRMHESGAAFLDSLTAGIAKAGDWADSLQRISIADWVLEQDATDGFASIRADIAASGLASAPDFEYYLRAFYRSVLGLADCDANNMDSMFFVGNKASRFYAPAASDYTQAKERFACRVNGGLEYVPDEMKDTFGFGAGSEGEVRVGAFSGNKFYTYDGGTWRTATAVEKDSYFVQASATSAFRDVQDVYEAIKPNERVIFILRHAERGDDTSKGGTLTSNGKNQSSDLGKKLTFHTEDFVLGASEFLRAHQTVEYIARGRGQQYDIRDTFPQLNDDWYIKDMDASNKAKDECGGGWEVTSKYAYTGAYTTGTTPAFYKLDERSVELIEDVILAKYNDPSQRFVMLSSHDKVMVPLVVYCTNKKVNLKKHDGGKWLNYLAGVAIIIDELGNRRYIPVRGLSSAYM